MAVLNITPSDIGTIRISSGSTADATDGTDATISKIAMKGRVFSFIFILRHTRKSAGIIHICLLESCLLARRH